MRLRVKLGTTLAGFVLGTLLTSIVAVVAMRSVFSVGDRVTAAYADDVAVVATLRNAAEREAASGRAFLIAGDEPLLRRVGRARAELRDGVSSLAQGATTTEDRRLIEDILTANEVYEGALDRLIAEQRTQTDPVTIRRTFDEQTRPAKDELTRSINALAQHKQQQLIDAEKAARTTRMRALVIVVSVGALAVIVAAALALALARTWSTAARQREDLARLLARVEQSNRDLEAFAERVAHDVRNALGPLALASSLLQQRGLPSALVEKTAAACSRSVEQARGLVDALLAFSRADKLADPLARASIREAVSAVTEELEPLLVQHDATLHWDVEDLDVRCPRALLGVILTNVVGNAVKFLRDRPERAVRISSQVTRGGCELRVDDTGPGIPDEALGRIFEPFFRVPGTIAPGTGIGLATVHRIVEAHGGRITVQSEVGEGTSFRIWIPLATSAGLTTAEQSAVSRINGYCSRDPASFPRD